MASIGCTRREKQQVLPSADAANRFGKMFYWCNAKFTVGWRQRPAGCSSWIGKRRWGWSTWFTLCSRFWWRRMEISVSFESSRSIYKCYFAYIIQLKIHKLCVSDIPFDPLHQNDEPRAWHNMMPKTWKILFGIRAASLPTIDSWGSRVPASGFLSLWEFKVWRYFYIKCCLDCC